MLIEFYFQYIDMKKRKIFVRVPPDQSLSVQFEFVVESIDVMNTIVR